VHPYLGASPACWGLWGEVQLRRPGQLGIDAYAVQHPGVPERRSIQSVALHLMTLCLVFERGMDPAHGSKLHQRLVRRLPELHWLDPPAPNGTLTVADVVGGTSVEDWARNIWEAWSPHHELVRDWLDKSLG
jgi:Family of unknown function (DUF5946)